MFPKGPVLKSWPPTCGAETQWNLEEAEPSGRKLGHWSHDLEGDPGPAPSLFSLSRLQGVCQQPPLPHTPVMTYCAARGSWQWGQVA